MVVLPSAIVLQLAGAGIQDPRYFQSDEKMRERSHSKRSTVTPNAATLHDAITVLRMH
jgi:hypothetical protein